MRVRNFPYLAFALPLLLLRFSAAADEPKPTPENTISIKLENEVKPQTFPRPIKFFIEKVVDRCRDVGNVVVDIVLKNS